MKKNDWFAEARFGMFIHWGLYALVARSGYGSIGYEVGGSEWWKSREEISEEHYGRYFDRFEAERFDARSWVELASRAGMKYVVLTAKHHDGFCLWDSAHTEYKVTNTPLGRDVVAEFVAACREQGLRIGLYYSLLDWHHPGFTIDDYHPRRSDPETTQRDMASYRQYMMNQLTELLTMYGQIDYLFFDMTYGERPGIRRGKSAEDWGAANIVTLVKGIQPDVLVNDRMGIPVDVVTPEQYQPLPGVLVEDGGTARWWEVCHTTNGSWGYDPQRAVQKSAPIIVRILADTVSKGGNVLLNVGPDAHGLIDQTSERILQEVGVWMSLHGRSIHGAGEFPEAANIRYPVTQSEDKVFVHLTSWPYRFLHLSEMGERVTYARFLHDGTEVPIVEVAPGQRAESILMAAPPPRTLTLEIPLSSPDGVAVPVIELTLDREQVA